MATTKRKAFAAELTAALSKKSGVGSSSSAQYSQTSGQTVVYTTIRDYHPEGVEKEDGLKLKKGEKVVLIQKSPDPESKRAKLDADSDLRQEIGGSLLDSSAAKHKLSVRPPKNHPRSRDASPGPGADAPPEALDASSRLLVQSLDSEETGWVPRCLLVKQEVQTYEHEVMELETEIMMETGSSAGGTASDALYCREAIVRELVDTEEEFGRDLQAVVDRYLKPLDSPSVPRAVRDNKDLVFSNLKQITEFHNTVLIEGVKYYADEPRMLGKTFLRLERDFDKHVQYCRDEPVAQEFLQENAEAREYFEERAQTLGDERSLSEHLKLPIQRIHDYQLLLKDLVRYSRKLGEDVTDLNRALELMLAIPHKATDNKFISNIEGYHGNIHKLGRLLRHDWFKVKFADATKEKDRYLFLFKARILVCKVRKIAGDRSVFVLKHIIRLPEVELRDHPDSPLTFELHHKFPESSEYPITLEAHRAPAKADWLSEIRQYAADILALAEHAADDLRVQQEGSESKFGSLKGVDLEITDDIVAEDIEQFTDSSSISHPLIEEQKRIKSQLKHVTVPERPPLEIPKKKEIFRFSDEDELVEEEIQYVAPAIEKRIEAGELIVKEESSEIVTSRSVRVEETGSVGKRIKAGKS